MESTTVAQCPFHQPVRDEYKAHFKPLHLNKFQRMIFDISEFLSRFTLESLKNAWRIGAQNDLSKTLLLVWQKNNLIAKCRTPKGTVYLTAEPNIVRTILQNYRKDENGIFSDHENKKLFIQSILNDIFPEDIKKIGIDNAADMIMLTASAPFVKSLRSILVSLLSTNKVKEFIPKMHLIAEDILGALSDQEMHNCNVEQLGFEFTLTVISKFFTGYHTTNTHYKKLAKSLDVISKHMTRLVSHRPSTEIEKEEYQNAIFLIRKVIEENTKNETTLFVKGARELGWTDFQIKANLFFMYFAASETTVSSINYLLWQLGKPEHSKYIEKTKHPEEGKHYLQKLIAETLRLNSPSFIQGRQLRCDTLLEITDANGKIIKKLKLHRGNSILCLSQAAGLNPKHYDNPTEFNPDRFNQVPSQLPWYPFGTGNHVCPGQHLAYAELEVFVSKILSQFSIETIFPLKETQQAGFFTLRATAAKIRLDRHD